MPESGEILQSTTLLPAPSTFQTPTSTIHGVAGLRLAVLGFCDEVQHLQICQGSENTSPMQAHASRRKASSEPHVQRINPRVSARQMPVSFRSAISFNARHQHARKDCQLKKYLLISARSRSTSFQLHHGCIKERLMEKNRRSSALSCSRQHLVSCLRRPYPQSYGAAIILELSICLVRRNCVSPQSQGLQLPAMPLARRV